MKREKERDRAAAARKLYSDYLKVALVHPDLSIAEYDKNNKLSADQYDTFVSIMLYSFDEMMLTDNDKVKDMTQLIEWQTELHEDYFREIFSTDDKGNWRGNYSQLLFTIIDRKLKELSDARV